MLHGQKKLVNFLKKFKVVGEHGCKIMKEKEQITIWNVPHKITERKGQEAYAIALKKKKKNWYLKSISIDKKLKAGKSRDKKIKIFTFDWKQAKCSKFGIRFPTGNKQE